MRTEAYLNIKGRVRSLIQISYSRWNNLLRMEAWIGKTISCLSSRRNRGIFNSSHLVNRIWWVLRGKLNISNSHLLIRRKLAHFKLMFKDGLLRNDNQEPQMATMDQIGTKPKFKINLQLKTNRLTSSKTHSQRENIQKTQQ